MKQQSSLEQKYKDLMRQSAPDLWSRIEGSLKEHPDRAVCRENVRDEKAVLHGFVLSRKTVYKRMAFGTAASAAAVFLMMAAIPRISSLFPAGNQAGTETEAFDGIQAEAGMAAETAPAFEEYEATDLRTAAADEDRALADSGTLTPAGVVLYSQLGLPAYKSLTLPAGAVTLPEDTMYFSEDILGDTQLLCLGTVTSVVLEEDPAGNPASLVYDIRLDSVCYSEDYTADFKSLTVKSPIIKSEGGSSQILYQLQAGASYLLPLKRQDTDWELLFPFAPQIQAVGNGAYLFHSGYVSLADSNTSLVVGEQEGANDFYYDRMLLREDDDFLSDFISLVTAYGDDNI